MFKMKGKDKIKVVDTGKKLKDYPAVPGTPPPEPRKDKEILTLDKEVDRERLYMDILQRENKEIEKILQDLEKELNYVKNHFPQNLDGDGKIHADNEYWFKYEAQMEVNRKLEKERRHLESEIKQMEEQGMINLDSLTQSELILYVKQLERTKTDLLSDLRAKEWSLDKQAKDYHHLNETKRALEAEIKHYDGERALFQHYKRIACPSASVSVSRQSSQKSSAKRGCTLRLRDGRRLGGTVSQENLNRTSGGDIMFRSLDETKLENVRRPSLEPSNQTRMDKEGGDGKETSEAQKHVQPKTGSLPELVRACSKKPAEQPKMVRSQSEHNWSKRPSMEHLRSSRGAVAMNDSEQTPTEIEEVSTWGRSQSGTESGIGSPSDDGEEYEDDFEESGPEAGTWKSDRAVHREQFSDANFQDNLNRTDQWFAVYNNHKNIRANNLESIDQMHDQRSGGDGSPPLTLQVKQGWDHLDRPNSDFISSTCGRCCPPIMQASASAGHTHAF